MSSILAVSLWVLAQQYLNWLVLAVIVVVGLFVWGIRDVRRFSLGRTRAIAGVSFAESVRRRVLLITPLAMIGVVLVSQFGRPLDEMDAIRLTTKYSLFATGLVIVITMVILACTNLPREIESRVIYTIVTKPTTRLEIVLGKVMGFAGVALVILLIMGAFTYGYLWFQSWNMHRSLVARLEADAVSPVARPTLEHYRDAGLLNARSLAVPQEVDFFSRLPAEQGRVWINAEGEQEILVPFDLETGSFVPPDNPEALPGETGVIVHANVMYRKVGEPVELPQRVPFVVAPYERVPAQPPQVMFSLRNHYNVDLSIPLGTGPTTLTDPNGTRPVQAAIPPQGANALATVPYLYVRVIGLTPGFEYSLDADSIELRVPAQGSDEYRVIEPQVEPLPDEEPFGAEIRGLVGTGREGRYGTQLRGNPEPRYAPLAVFQFRDVDVDLGRERIPMELRAGVERGGIAPEDETPTVLEISVYNRTTGELSEPVTVPVESQRTAFFHLPADALTGGDVDVRVRNLTVGHYAGLLSTSIAIVAEEGTFALNLARSLLVLWLMAILVVTVAVFCSTFLSWPVAVVLTLVILLGHWGVQQLGDAVAPGVGRSFVSDLGLQDPSVSATVSESVEALIRTLAIIASFLPDISEFSATEDIERGITLSWTQIGHAAGVTFGFGLALVVLAYVLLKQKEVAP